jgi:O-antigen/teichoic acid export membrane protein
VQFAGFFHLDRVEPVVIASLSLPALFLLPVLSGSAQGLQRFGLSVISSISGAVSRLALGAGFVWFLYPASGWAMLGHGLGVYVSTAVLLYGLFPPIRKAIPSDQAIPSMRLYILQSFLILAAYSVLMNADVVLVKHFLPVNTEFAYAAILSRIVVFLPGAIVVVMFPKVTSTGKSFSAEKRKVFLKSLVYTALCVVLSVVVCALIPGVITRILFGMRETSDSLRRMILIMTIAMGINALASVAIQYHLAQRRCKVLIPAILFSLMYLLSACLFHESAMQIALAAGVFNAATLFFALFEVFRNPCQQGRARENQPPNQRLCL